MNDFVDLRDAAFTQRVNSRGAVQRQYDYFGKSSPYRSGPEAFLVDYGPDRVTTAHFHSVDQFQIFFGAPGATYQRRSMPWVEVHYADAFHTYGPFAAGANRIRFFTLRPCEGQWKGDMPADRDKLPYRGRRGIHVDLAPLMSLGAGSHDVIARQPDGLSAQLVIARGNASIPPFSAEGTNGAWVCVLSGSVVSDARELRRLSLCWVAADETCAGLHAGPTGTSVVVLTYPFPPTPTLGRSLGD